jgi:hypothetical protein
LSLGLALGLDVGTDAADVAGTDADAAEKWLLWYIIISVSILPILLLPLAKLCPRAQA